MHYVIDEYIFVFIVNFGFLDLYIFYICIYFYILYICIFSIFRIFCIFGIFCMFQKMTTKDVLWFGYLEDLLYFRERPNAGAMPSDSQPSCEGVAEPSPVLWDN